MAFSGKATYSGGEALPEIVEDVSDIIGIVSPYETPLLDHIGDAKRSALSTRHEWLEDSLLPNTGVINDQSISSPQADTSVDVADGTIFRVGDLVRLGDGPEIVSVEAVSGNTLTLIRRYGGTVSSSLVDSGELTILSNAALEGAEASESRFTTRVRRENFTQIFASTVEVSGSMGSVATHGVADELDYQKQERLRELLRDLENSVINGVAPTSSEEGSASVRRTMDGIVNALLTDALIPGSGGVDPGGGSGNELNEAVLNSALKQIWDRSSGSVDTIVVGGAQKRRINSFVSAQRGYTPDDDRYRDMVSVYESDFGVCRVVMSRWMPRDKVLLLDSSRIDVLPLAGRSFGFKPLAQTGDSMRGQVIGEYTMELRNAEAHGVLAGLAI